MSKLKQYNLYTISNCKFVYTETKTLEDALYNFNHRVNLDFNAIHTDMKYDLYEPLRVLTSKSIEDDNEDNIPNYYRHKTEKIIGFNCNKLNKIILKDR